MRPFPFRKKWSNAVKTACDCGRTHPSKMEAAVCRRLRFELLATPGAYILHQVRWPLPNLGPTPEGGAHFLSVDFTIVTPGGLRFVDAKSPGRVSRDWRRGAAAFRGHYGQAIEEVAK
jgi:hypothetical protein